MQISVHFKLTSFPDDRPAAMVVSHERSGTHFLMNSLASCYGYKSDPSISLDWSQVPINYYHSGTLSDALLHLAGNRTANVVKSHHQPDFFADKLDQIT